MWDQILTGCSDLLEDFNDDLLLDFRKRKINQIPVFLDELFRESVNKLGNRLSYNGYRVLSPDEVIQYVRTNKILAKRVQILNSTFQVIRFEYEFQGEKEWVHVFVPYLYDNHIQMANTSYWPLLPEVDSGGLHRTKDEIILKVMCAPITLYRSASFTFHTDKGKVYKEVVNQVKIHQGRKGRGKNACMVPMILYHLVYHQFDECMLYYGFQPGEIQIVQTYKPEQDYSYIKIVEDIYLRVKDTALDDMYRRRVIASYLTCLNEWSHFNYRDLVSTNLMYYRVVLGRYTYSQIRGTDPNKAVMYADNAGKHLATTDTILDEPAKVQLRKIGINVDNIYDFLLVAFYKMDEWLVNYSPCDLYDKKIGSLDSIMSPLVYNINKKLFVLVNAKDAELKLNTVRSAIKKCSQMENWVTTNPAFRANPAFCNDNELITIIGKRFRSLENVETAGSRANKKTKVMTNSLLKAHPSHLVVESIVALPESSPVVSGEINPYLIIDDNGQILKPSWAFDLEHIYD